MIKRQELGKLGLEIDVCLLVFAYSLPALWDAGHGHFWLEITSEGVLSGCVNGPFTMCSYYTWQPIQGAVPAAGNTLDG